jgi:hypothetical protein
MDVPDELELFAQMCFLRHFEERADALCRQGLIHGPVHLGLGQEAIAVGAASVLRPSGSGNSCRSLREDTALGLLARREKATMGEVHQQVDVSGFPAEVGKFRSRTPRTRLAESAPCAPGVGELNAWCGYLVTETMWAC